MPILRRDDTVQTAQGWAIAGAEVYYLEQPANVQSLTPLAQVYSDLSGTPAANPQITDGFGHAVAYLDNSQLYTIVWKSSVIGEIVYTDQNVGNAVSSLTISGSVPSGTIDGSNKVFTVASSSQPVLVEFIINGQTLHPGVGFTWSYSSGVITITLSGSTPAPQDSSQAPPDGDYLYAIVFA